MRCSQSRLRHNRGQKPLIKLPWTVQTNRATSLNSIEIVTIPWWFLTITGQADNGFDGWMNQRLGHMEKVLSERQWLAANRFTVADLLMADVLRVGLVRAYGERPATEAYIRRVIDRPAFRKAHADQMAHFAAADKTRTKLK
jgi:glutathione S-transferase